MSWGNQGITRAEWKTTWHRVGQWWNLNDVYFQRTVIKKSKKRSNCMNRELETHEDIVHMWYSWHEDILFYYHLLYHKYKKKIKRYKTKEKREKKQNQQKNTFHFAIQSCRIHFRICINCEFKKPDNCVLFVWQIGRKDGSNFFPFTFHLSDEARYWSTNISNSS